MEQKQESENCIILWRGQKFTVEINPQAAVKDLGDHLQKLTNVKPDTMRLIVPLDKRSIMLYPFSEEHSFLSLEAASVLQGKSIRMMGVLQDEVDEVLQNAKVDLRIAGFDEEERRLRMKNSNRPNTSHKLPQGTYIFCDFRTLNIPGMELNPPVSKALELLHMLASDPAIVAIMNKHQWRVGILTEMAPVGYVGVSPKCILGVNKNHGEEISLRLRTDDLMGFRKYESIKKTLLHELAHMLYSEHDTNFYALDKQLNEEATTLDWTKSRGHTLSRFTYSPHYHEEFDANSNATSSQRLGGQASNLHDARASSVSAAYQRVANTSSRVLRISENALEPDTYVDYNDTSVEFKPSAVSGETPDKIDLDLDNSQMKDILPSETVKCENLKSDILGGSLMNDASVGANCTGGLQENIVSFKPLTDDSGVDVSPTSEKTVRPDCTDSYAYKSMDIPCQVNMDSIEPEQNDSQAEVMSSNTVCSEASSMNSTVPPDPNDPDLQIFQDPVSVFCGRLQNAIKMLKNEVNPLECGMALHTLVKIFRNIIEHPNEMKFKKLRKANPTLQKNIVNHKAAMDILILIGFSEDVIVDENGKGEIFFILKRNDPGMLWLAKSSLEAYIE